MPELRDGIYVEETGPLQVNCYLVMPPSTSRLYIIDPGGDRDLILNAAKSFKFDSAEILLTHAHVDHISGLDGLASRLGAEVRVHPDDASLYSSPRNHLMPFVPPATGLPECSWPPADSEELSAMHTPGHTRGGVCYLFNSLNALFSGDTLFCGSIGRTDLPGGDHSLLLSSIKGKLLTLPDSIEVFPGHGPSSTIGEERRSNPYLASL